MYKWLVVVYALGEIYHGKTPEIKLLFEVNLVFAIVCPWEFWNFLQHFVQVSVVVNFSYEIHLPRGGIRVSFFPQLQK